MPGGVCHPPTTVAAQTGSVIVLISQSDNGAVRPQPCPLWNTYRNTAKLRLAALVTVRAFRVTILHDVPLLPGIESSSAKPTA
jgi:hypothetical protein